MRLIFWRTYETQSAEGAEVWEDLVAGVHEDEGVVAALCLGLYRGQVELGSDESGTFQLE